MNILFDREQQEIFGPQGHHQNNYTYYSGSNREEIIQIRLQLEKWFEAYPDSDKDDLRNNFKNDFDAGFFELFLFTLFQKIGYCVKIHPKVPNSTKKPDFLVTGFGQEFYLEAKVSFYDSQEEKSAKKMLASLYSVLDQSDISDFFIYIRRIALKGNQQPRANIIRKAMEKTINSYDVNDLFEKMNNGKINQPFIHIYEDDNIYIEYGPIPKSNKGRGKKNHRAIGVYGMDAKILNNVESLRKALKVKSGRYGILDKPYLIAINAVDMLALDKDDVMDCLMGSTCIVPELITNQNAFQEFREHDGFFTGRNDKGQNTRVSAAMITKIHPSNWRDSDYWIFENEMAILPINLRNSSLIIRFIQDGIIYRTSGKSFGDIIVY